MPPHGRRRLPFLTLLLSIVFLFSATASAASAVLGIDLGTEYMKAVLVKPGIPLEIVLTKDSRRKEASAVAFKPLKAALIHSDSFPERLYGGDAVALAARFPGDVYPNLKPLLGLRVGESPIIQGYNERHPQLGLVENEVRGTAAFKSDRFAQNEEPFLVEELLAMELQNIRGNAEALAGKGSTIRDAVITIPAFYTAEEKMALELAADLAGLRVLALVSDGLAVGLNYATSRIFPSVTEGGKPEYHLVYDMGAGSTSATVLRFQGRTVKDVGKFNKTIQEVSVLGTGWDRTLGGDALNGVLINKMLEDFVQSSTAKKEGIKQADVKRHGRATAKLWKEAERVRQVLSANSETMAGSESLYEDVDFRHKITRADFEELTSSYAERVVGPLERALTAAKLDVADLDSIILHGGAVRTPFVQKRLEAKAGDAGKIRSNVNADEAAVFGAAFQGAGLSPSFRVKEIRTTEGSGYAVGAKWTSDGKERQQKLFMPTSQLGNEKQVPFKNLEDFSFSLYQQLPAEDSSQPRESPVLKIQTQNLTASVAQLTEKFGCTAADISTTFSIRLSSSNGLPEVMQGSVSCEVNIVDKKGGVVDDVKGFFGFGGKKGDQEPLKGDEEVPDSANSIEEPETKTISTQVGSQTANPSAKVDDVKEAKKRTELVYLSFTAENQGLPRPSQVELKRITDRLAAFDTSDRNRRLREETLNTLEAFTYRSRDLLSDESFIGASTEKLRAEIESQLHAASDWLYGDGADASRDTLKDRLKGLRDLVDPVQKRKEEAVKRPEQIRLLKEAIDQIKQIATMVEVQVNIAASSSSSISSEPDTTSAPSSVDDDFADLEDETTETVSITSSKPSPTPQIPSYTLEDLKTLTSSYESAQNWLTAKLAEQDKLSPSDDPAFLSADMEEKAVELNRIVKDLLQQKMQMPPKARSSNKSKPKTKSKSKKGKGTSSAASAEATRSREKFGDTPVFKVENGDDMPTEEEILEVINRQKGKEHDEL
ncbi:MAG: lumenal Hsp70 protein [Pycnora praestabilis]|nr:MAG: lumenal Hsp70 protein [Pycnora praestabilis]